jgi:predicted enzyme related to lactoylglutathione lyase
MEQCLWVIEDTSFVPGLVCWIDVSSTDPAGSQDFYAGLFGWTYQIDPDSDRRHSAARAATDLHCR